MELWTDNTFKVIILGFVSYYVVFYCFPAWARRLTHFARRMKLIRGPTVLNNPPAVVPDNQAAAAGDASFFRELSDTLSAIWPRGEPILADPSSMNIEEEVDEEEFIRDQELYRQFKENQFQDDDDDDDPDYTPSAPMSVRQRSSYSFRFRGHNAS